MAEAAAADAHRYTEARLPDKSNHRWQKPGGLALERMALTEAIAQLNKGLDLVAALSASAERDGRKLDLRLRLGTAWMTVKGWRSLAAIPRTAGGFLVQADEPRRPRASVGGCCSSISSGLTASHGAAASTP